MKRKEPAGCSLRARPEPYRAIPILLAILLLPPACRGGTVALSSVGTLTAPTDFFEEVFTLSATSDIQIRTWGFGGGTNAAGTAIPAGGFDPLIALFSGSAATASIFMSGGNAAAAADNLGSAGNCPPAGTVTIGTGAGSALCGDVALILSGVPAGTYTLVLSDANYIPFAVNPGPPDSTLLSDGFADLTGGVFQTCNMTSDGTFCIAPTGNFAVDIASQSGGHLEDLYRGVEHGDAPEPAAAALTLIGLAALGVFRRTTGKVKGGRKCSISNVV